MNTMNHESVRGFFLLVRENREREEGTSAKKKFMEKTKTEIPASAMKSRAAREYLGGISTPTLHRLLKRGLIRANRSTRHLIFLRSELDRFLNDGMI